MIRWWLEAKKVNTGIHVLERFVGAMGDMEIKNNVYRKEEAVQIRLKGREQVSFRSACLIINERNIGEVTAWREDCKWMGVSVPRSLKKRTVALRKLDRRS